MSEFFYTWSKQTGIPSFPIQRAENDHFVLDDGSEVYDFISTSFQASFGHSNRWIINSMANQLNVMSMAPPKATFPLKEAVTQRLIDFVGLGKGKIFYTVSGAEAVENAIKMARRITGRPIILSRQRSYHGASLGAMSVSGDWRSQEHLNFTAGTERIPEPDTDPYAEGASQVVLRVGADRIAAVIVETVSGTNGVIIPPQSWFTGLREMCNRHGLILILDEVLAGFFRCSRPFAFQSFGAQPDMVCMSKALTGGYIPMGAVWTNPEIAGFYDDQPLVGGLTNYAHPIGLAAIHGVMQQIEQPEFRASLAKLEEHFAECVQSIAGQHAATSVRRLGMLAALEFSTSSIPTSAEFLQAGLHLYTKENMMILAPPLTTQPDRMSQAFRQLSSVLQ